MSVILNIVEDRHMCTARLALGTDQVTVQTAQKVTKSAPRNFIAPV